MLKTWCGHFQPKRQPKRVDRDKYELEYQSQVCVCGCVHVLLQILIC